MACRKMYVLTDKIASRKRVRVTVQIAYHSATEKIRTWHSNDIGVNDIGVGGASEAETKITVNPIHGQGGPKVLLHASII